MLLLHQTGSVKIGEVVRYTVTYTPANDRILPAPTHLFLKIKNTSTVALRAAFIHGPYTLYVSSTPANFHPDQKLENPRRDGVPEFEPNLKAGGTWYSKLSVPEDVRETAGSAQSRDDGLQKSMSWIVEVASQVIFSNSAAVHYEVLLGRDEKSLSLPFMGTSSTQGIPGQVKDHQQSQGAKDGHHAAQQRGVFSKAIKLKVEDTATLWNKPKLPEWDDAGKEAAKEHNADAPTENAVDQGPDLHIDKKQKKVHLVVLTHGLHSNLGADMLYMKESIDEATMKAKEDAKKRRRRSSAGPRDDSKAPAEHKEDGTDQDEDDEEVIVRGYSGNAVRTEKGIKYLGKRLAKYVLSMTYPDQPFKPISRSASAAITGALKHEKDEHGLPIHAKSSIREEPHTGRPRPYKITSISFIAHSLGGPIQTYAIAYIQKHSPHFFDTIKPINFIALASPFLGLSNENPLYVKFALDFGLVGRTGQDLGLTWRAPTIARGGWSAIVGGIGESAHKKLDGNPDPGAKPLLRILPTGPAHIALKKFRNRTVYSNVVNDGIVPLRTSCLLFLDWSGLGRVEKARRENGLIGTVAGWGWAELTGANAGQHRRSWAEGESGGEDTGANTPTKEGKGGEVPQPSETATDDDARSIRSLGKAPSTPGSLIGDEDNILSATSPTAGTTHNAGAFDTIMGLFKPSPSPKSHNHSPKKAKIYKRSQTLKIATDDTQDKGQSRKKSPATNGDAPQDADSLAAPPKTTFFESAGDLIAPPMPPVEFLIDPSTRPRTIFHDRVYHPEDIPPPPLKRRSTTLFGSRKSSGSSSIISPTSPSTPSNFSSGTSLSSHVDDDAPNVVDDSAMKVEEKIARAYHRDLSWRKVLVRLEPDAHNNMIVRRRFANAYGWPVVKHLVDTHFSDSAAANTRDEDETNEERAKEDTEDPNSDGGETKDGPRKTARKPRIEVDGPIEDPRIKPLTHRERTDSEDREATDKVPALNSLRPGNLSRVLSAATSAQEKEGRPRYRERQDSAQWSDRDFEDSDDESVDIDHISSSDHPNNKSSPDNKKSKSSTSASGWNWTEAIVGKGLSSPKGTKQEEIDAFLGKGKGQGLSPVLSRTQTQGGAQDGTVGLGSASSMPGTGFVEQLAGVKLDGNGKMSSGEERGTEREGKEDKSID